MSMMLCLALCIGLLGTVGTAFAVTSVTSVSITGLDAPVSGKTPDRTVTLNTTGCQIEVGPSGGYNVQWVNNTFGGTLGWNDTFIAGASYTATISISPKSGYDFSANGYGNPAVSATIDGKAAQVSWTNIRKDCIDISITFAASGMDISTVDIYGVDTPVPGNAPDWSLSLAHSTYKLYNNEPITWYDKTAGRYLNQYNNNDRFIEGHVYSLNVWLQANTDSGYFFKLNSSNKPAVNAFVNDETAQAANAYEQVPGEVLSITYDFAPCETPKISWVSISGIDTPKAGAVPDYSASISHTAYRMQNKSNTYTKNGVKWFDRTANKDVAVGTPFEAGHGYNVELWLEPAYGKAFSETAYAYVNNTTVGVTVMGGSDGLVVYYKFDPIPSPASVKKISFAAVKGIEVPQANAAPDTTAEVIGSEFKLASADPIRWYDVTAGKQVIPGYDSFTAGHQYEVYVSLVPSSGYEFAVESGTVNGYYAQVAGQTAQSLTLIYMFEQIPATADTALHADAAAESSSSLAADAKPTDSAASSAPAATVDTSTQIDPAAKPMFTFVDVASDAYYFEAVQWAVATGVTTGTSATHFSPDMTCSQAHILTFLWRAAGRPQPTIASPYINAAVKPGQYFYEAFVWAWEKGLISNIYLDPNSPCSRSDVVTYLWKLEGSPDSGSSAFDDVPASAPYAKAVAWAVAKGITNGTSATTFSPAMTCTRGQIVTFLWRYVNS